MVTGQSQLSHGAWAKSHHAKQGVFVARGLNCPRVAGIASSSEAEFECATNTERGCGKCQYIIGRCLWYSKNLIAETGGDREGGRIAQVLYTKSKKIRIDFQ